WSRDLFMFTVATARVAAPGLRAGRGCPKICLPGVRSALFLGVSLLASALGLSWTPHPEPACAALLGPVREGVPAAIGSPFGRADLGRRHPCPVKRRVMLQPGRPKGCSALVLSIPLDERVLKGQVMP